MDYVKVNLLDYGGDLKALGRAPFKFYGEVHILDGVIFTPSSVQCYGPDYNVTFLTMYLTCRSWEPTPNSSDQFSFDAKHCKYR